jgi:hypothetical protein
MEKNMSKNNQIFPWGIYIGNLIDQDDTIPLFFDSKQGGFCVFFDKESEDIANIFIENMALKLFELMPVGGIEVDVFDFGHKKRFSYLSALANMGVYTISFNPNRISIRFDNLEEIALDRHHNLLSFETPTLCAYNQESQEAEKYHLLLIDLDSFPDTRASFKQIENFFSSAYQAGFYTIAFGDQEILKSNSEATQAILKQFLSIRIRGGQFEFTQELFKFTEDIFELNELLREFDYEYINDNRGEMVKELLSRFKKEQQNEPEQDFLTIIIGSVGREKLHFNMGLKSQNYHAFIAGMTGMGKTNLLNSIIINIAKNYTSKEVELYLMDYKSAGSEFIIFKNHPNCKKLFLGNQNPTLAFEMLQEFQNEMYTRGEILGAKSIDAYNLANPNALMVRKILIIDEVQRMFSEDWKELNAFNGLVEDIIKAGRSYGLHLILTTQSLKQIKMNESIMGQVPLKISFRLSDRLEAMKIFHENRDAINNVVKLQKYQFIYSDFTQTVTAKADYLDKDNIEKILKNIRNSREKDEVVTPFVVERVILNEKKEKKSHGFTPKYETDSAKELMQILAKMNRKKRDEK